MKDYATKLLELGRTYKSVIERVKKVFKVKLDIGDVAKLHGTLKKPVVKEHTKPVTKDKVTKPHPKCKCYGCRPAPVKEVKVTTPEKKEEFKKACKYLERQHGKAPCTETCKRKPCQCESKTVHVEELTKEEFIERLGTHPVFAALCEATGWKPEEFIKKITAKCDKFSISIVEVESEED